MSQTDAPDPTTPSGTPDPTTAADRTDPTPSPTPRTRVDDPLRSSRTSGAWTAVVGSVVLIVLLVIFIVQNTDSVPITFLWIDGRAPLAVALLIATAVGLSVAGLVGSMRILQLRRRVRRGAKQR